MYALPFWAFAMSSCGKEDMRGKAVDMLCFFGICDKRLRQGRDEGQGCNMLCLFGICDK